MEYHIRTWQLTKIYKRWFKPSITAIQNLTMEVPAGVKMGFLGPNGAGKTTTIKLLLGLVYPTSGKVEILGYPVHHPKAHEQVAYMPELPSLNLYDTPWNFLQLIAKLSKLDPQTRRQRLEEVIEELGIRPFLMKPVSQLSKGQKQRVELAQALLAMPKLLILDEPFSGLDPNGRHNIANLLIRYNQQNGTTIFFSSHNLNEIEQLCDMIGIMVKGKLRVLGFREELLPCRSIVVEVEEFDLTGLPFLLQIAKDYTPSPPQHRFILEPSVSVDNFKDMLLRYHAKNIKVWKETNSLEKLFLDTVQQSS